MMKPSLQLTTFVAMLRLLFLTGLAGLGFGLPQRSTAAVVFSGTQNLALPFNFNGVYLNIVTGATTTSTPADWMSGPWINPFFGGTEIWTSPHFRSVIIGDDQIVNLESGTVIDSNSNFAPGESGSSNHVGPDGNQFQIGVLGIIGFEFEATPGGPTLYGWMKLLTSNNSNGTSASWAYNNTAGEGIIAGQLLASPEPSRAVLLLAGMLGLVLRRRR